jgi:hypothetical protein
LNEVFALLWCYETLIASYRNFGTAYCPTFKDQTDVLTLMNYYSVQCVFGGAVTVEHWTLVKLAVCVYLGATYVHFKDLMRLHDKLNKLTSARYTRCLFWTQFWHSSCPNYGIVNFFLTPSSFALLRY